MNIRKLPKTASYYVATPYTLYPHGHEAAYRAACQLAADLMRAGFMDLFVPIAQSHGICVHGAVDHLSAVLWAAANEGHVRRCDILLVGKLDGWKKSLGIFEEIKAFEAVKKPVYYLDPATMELDDE